MPVAGDNFLLLINVLLAPSAVLHLVETLKTPSDKKFPF